MNYISNSLIYLLNLINLDQFGSNLYNLSIGLGSDSVGTREVSRFQRYNSVRTLQLVALLAHYQLQSEIKVPEALAQYNEVGSVSNYLCTL